MDKFFWSNGNFIKMYNCLLIPEAVLLDILQGLFLVTLFVIMFAQIAS